ncbi:cation-transporting P-type ATPase [Demequina capsici]|uniref:Cation-transporting P-type ATPase n=1 Tax=Demequina capsici TaxID=3075620 RepID=A0AA96JBL0_9MICO|nr:cation-transporting P-type ATPase [Demequina sp. PMTSA13]WNM28545.1 cation-transporting P-type ATPase [Demequina sp. PMTSA13]
MTTPTTGRVLELGAGRGPSTLWEQRGGVVMELGEPEAGLSTAEAARRLDRDGPNVVPAPRRRGWLRELARQLTHLLALVLWAASAMALLAGMTELAIAIVVVVVLNATFAFAQEHRADRSAEHLAAMMPARCRVRRDGRLLTIDAESVVVGDVVRLDPGDRVPADLRLHAAEGLKVDESMTTGESEPVVHGVGDAVMAGTFVVQGDGEGVVTATGAGTSLAEIAELTRTATRPPSPLTRQLARIARVVAVLAIGTGVLLGVVGSLLGLGGTQAFLFGVGVAVALVPEGLLPTVTLSLARSARQMAQDHALVRRLDSVETLGATTYICTDKTGTVTQNRMAVVEVVTPAGTIRVVGEGYEPVAVVRGPRHAAQAAQRAAAAADACVTGRVVPDGTGGWRAEGDPMEAAVDCLAARLGVSRIREHAPRRRPYSPDRMLSSAIVDEESRVIGAPEQVLARCLDVDPTMPQALARLTRQGRRVLAVAARPWQGGDGDDAAERDLLLLALLAIEDPPRQGVRDALVRCRRADIRVAMLTGDHPDTARAIGREIGLLHDGGLVVSGPELPPGDAALGELLDRPGGVVVARVSPADKLRIARALRARGHVVAMTGDGVNDAPALREADVGVAMGEGGSDVAREAADLVLLDDHFQTIVQAVELGRATFRNVRRFLTYHLTDNVAELAPFALWALSGGQVPLAITVLQVLALDIGTDMLPALALGAEPPSRRVMQGAPDSSVLDGRLLGRAGVHGLVEATVALGAFLLLLASHGWTWGGTPSSQVLALASGTVFASISVGQMANAFACRSEHRPVWRLRFGSNRLLLWAVATEALLLALFLVPPLMQGLLGGAPPSTLGWVMAVGGAVALLLVDAALKVLRRR